MKKNILSVNFVRKQEMMETKKLEEIIRPARPHRVGNGFHAYGFISGVPELSQKRMDPFLILDDNAS